MTPSVKRTRWHRLNTRLLRCNKSGTNTSCKCVKYRHISTACGSKKAIVQVRIFLNMKTNIS